METINNTINLTSGDTNKIIASIITETSKRVDVINLTPSETINLPVKITNEELAVENLQNILDLRFCTKKELSGLEEIYFLLSNA